MAPGGRPHSISVLVKTTLTGIVAPNGGYNLATEWDILVWYVNIKSVRLCFRR